MTEDMLQIASAKFLDEMAKYYKFYWLHVPNESRVAIKNFAWHNKRKALGLKSGFPDIAIFGNGGKVLFIELKVKRTKKDKDPKELLSPTQKTTIDCLTMFGFTCKIIVASDVREGLTQLAEIIDEFNEAK